MFGKKIEKYKIAARPLPKTGSRLFDGVSRVGFKVKKGEALPSIDYLPVCFAMFLQLTQQDDVII